MCDQCLPQPIKAHLAMRRITLKDLSGRTGRTATYLSRVANGREKASPALRRELSTLLGLPETDLFRPEPARDAFGALSPMDAA